jgi:hypothetical protein
MELMRFVTLCVLAACGGDGLSANEQRLAADGVRSVDADAVVVDVIERTFSSAAAVTPTDDGYADLVARAGTSADAATDTLGGCATADVSPFDPAQPANPVITYTLTGCTVGGHAIEGSVVSTWVLDEMVHVVHAVDATIDGVPVAGTVALQLYFGDNETRQRSYQLTAAGSRFEGAWTASYDANGCGTKHGRATVTPESGRTLSRVDDLQFCVSEGLGDLTGALTLSRDGLALDVLLSAGEAEVATRGERFALGLDDLID